MKTITIARYLILALISFGLMRINAQDIYSAVANGNVALTKEFLKKDPSLLNQRNSDLFTPLNLAAENGQTEVAELLLSMGADMAIGDRENSQPVHLAAISGSIPILDLLLKYGADIDTKDINLMTPLLFAASRGQIEMVNHLIDRGASTKARTSEDMTALHMAVISGNRDMIDIFLNKGIKVDVTNLNGETPLHYAATYGRDAAAVCLIERGAEVDAKDKTGFTPLYDAVAAGRLPLVKLLIDHGADVNANTPNGFVPLTVASWAVNAEEMGKYLILSGADVNPNPCKDDKMCAYGLNFRTPLHAACDAGKLDLVKVLINNGAKVNLFSNDGWTPLQYAVRLGDPAAVKYLVEHGAFLNVRDREQGATELHLAAAMGFGDIAAYLLDQGSRPDVRDIDGKTPLDYAFYHGQNPLGYKLLADGASDEYLTAYLNYKCPLKKSLKTGEAEVIFLGHSGWAVKTQNHLLVFDYFDNPRERKADHNCLLSGCIDPDELKTLDVAVFSTHSHTDHFNPSCFEWKESIPGINYILCFEPENVTEEYTYVPVNSSAVVDGMNIYAGSSTDHGGSFVVEADGLVIFHMGDLANGEDELMTSFTGEIDKIAARNKKIDIMFGPVRGCGLGTPEQVKAGTYYALEKLQPGVFAPMHAGNYTFAHKQFIDQALEDGVDQPMKHVITKGDRFSYRQGDELVSSK